MPEPNSPNQNQTKSRELEAAIAAYLVLRQRERQTAKRLLLAERSSLARIRQALREVVGAVALVASDPGRLVRQASPALIGRFEVELRAAKLEARKAAASDIEQSIYRGAVLTSIDEASAHTTAASLAASWGQQVIGGAKPASTIAAMDPRLRRAAVNETSASFNDQREEAIDERPGSYKVWDAVLDARTCSICFGMDGTIVEAGKAFKEPIPNHPFCRCIVEFVDIPKPERLEDIRFDYDLFKSELRDQVREGRSFHEPRVKKFVAASQGATRSPVVLTKRLRVL